MCIYILLYGHKRPSGAINKFLLLTTITMFTISSVHMAMGFFRGLAAFIDSQHIEDGALTYYESIWEWQKIFKQALYATNKYVSSYTTLRLKCWMCACSIVSDVVLVSSSHNALFRMSTWLKPTRSTVVTLFGEAMLMSSVRYLYPSAETVYSVLV